MKAVIYAINDQSRWTWGMSLDATLHIDRLFWTSRSEQPPTSMYRVVNDMPFGQAIALMKMNNAHLMERPLSNGMDQEKISLYAAQNGLQKVPLEGYQAGHTGSKHHDNIVNSDIEDDEFIERIDDVQWWDKLSYAMKGRCLLWEEFIGLLDHLGIAKAEDHWREIAQWAYLCGHIELSESLAVASGSKSKSSVWSWGSYPYARCLRCGHSGKLIRRSACSSCGELSCAYCESCLTMGRTRACAPMIMGTEAVSNERDRSLLEHSRQSHQKQDDVLDITAPIVPVGDWQLSAAQLAASEAGIRHLLRKYDRPPKPYLIWAVTGAGKTEMIFPLVATELQRGGKVLIATPRRDVVLELLPRIKLAFPAQQVIALYGGSTQRWESGDITIATTHQLLRYEAAFDLVVIDEIDAFPYHNNPILEYAAQKARAKYGSVVLLSATPPTHLQVDARKGKLAHVKVPVRYHGKPLPLPRIVRYSGIHKLHVTMNNGDNKSPSPTDLQSIPNVASKLLHWLPPRDGSGKLAALLAQSLERGAQVFIFVPTIHSLEPALAWVRSRMDRLCNRTQIEATSSQDEYRHDKILRFRATTTRILLTTTILERGVTIPKADVIVLDADSALFDSAALVQMAGRAGRSAADPYGNVHFLSKERTRSQNEAISQIRAMNRLAERRGYIIKGT